MICPRRYTLPLFWASDGQMIKCCLLSFPPASYLLPPVSFILRRKHIMLPPERNPHWSGCSQQLPKRASERRASGQNQPHPSPMALVICNQTKTWVTAKGLAQTGRKECRPWCTRLIWMEGRWFWLRQMSSIGQRRKKMKGSFLENS